MTKKVIEVQKRDNLTVIFIDNPPYNFLSAQVFAELKEALLEAQSDPNTETVVITGRGIFSAGADVKEIWKIIESGDKEKALALVREANSVTNLIENLDKLTVAAIEGPCYGGGNEIAMACALRVASEDAKFAQPEINLGIMPGMGGTQRLPRLVGIHRALSMLLSGNAISAKEAKELDLVDSVAPRGKLISQTKSAIEEFLSGRLWLHRAGKYFLEERESDFVKKMMSTKSFEAVLAIEKAAKEGLGMTLIEGLELEQELFANLIFTENARKGVAKLLKIKRPSADVAFPKTFAPDVVNGPGKNSAEELKMLRETVRSFAEEVIKPKVAEMEKNEQIPMELVKKIAEFGLLGVSFEEKYGGFGLGKTGYCVVAEELSRVHPSTALLYGAHTSLACGAINIAGNEEQKEKYLKPAITGDMIGAFALTEPNAGSDAANIDTTAEEKDGFWILNGRKQFITNGDFADFVVVIAQTDKSLGKKGLTAFIVETKWPGFSVGKHEDKTGLRASHTVQLFLDNVKVPKENMLGKVREGFKVAMKTLNGGRLGLGAGCIGISKACYELAFKYAGERKQFGQTINMFQANQFALAMMATKIKFMEYAVYQVAQKTDAGKDMRLESAMVKLMCSEMCWEIADSAIQVFGGYGLIKDYVIEMFWRDCRYNRVFEGTNQIQQLFIISELFNSWGVLENYEF
ncbi:MAG: acyl-CoA dehydrogenase family protein [Candidatus Yanofskybacteria bacterium]|nr:acyl-CoA dehydrogenase family protein [Candidatus Yanofskybacteria bacterium]